MNRREFIGGGAALAALAGCGTLKTSAGGSRPKAGDIRSFLVHLGHNMWSDWYPEDMDISMIKDGLPDRKLRCRDDFWRASVDYVASKGVNQLVVFSTTHSGWTKHYRRMVGLPEYYGMCEDVLKDVSEVFGRPRFIHIGREIIAKDHLYGFMMVPWAACDTQENVDFIKRGADLFADALR